MEKPAVTRYPLHDLIARRWSPRAFTQRVPSSEVLGSLFEAARWAPSCFNDQPWRFLVASKDRPERFERLASCLVESNRQWAEHAPVLALSMAQTGFRHNGKPNRHAGHDVGLAVAMLSLQAQALSLAVHQMAGFDATRARQLFGIPDECEPMAMLAIGEAGDPEQLPEKLRARELAPRERLPLSSLVFGERFGSSEESFASES